ncbi:MAG TPA: hypothetical protein VM487_19915 [Phycisphaerae bacterium]|nr:hypothetical protein [Phycisphaerae bacterium]
MRYLLLLLAVLAMLIVTGPVVAQQADIVLPTVNGQRWHVTLIYSDPSTRADVTMASWLFGHAECRGVLGSATLHAMSTGDPAFKAADAKGRSWLKFAASIGGSTPMLIVQDPLANRVYTTMSIPKAVNPSGSPVVPIPASADQLVDGIQRAAVSWKGFTGRLGILARPTPKPEADFPPQAIMEAATRMDLSEGPDTKPELLLRLLANRRQHWCDYQKGKCGPSPGPEPVPDVDIDTSVDLGDLANQWNQFEQPTPIPVEEPAEDASPPLWFWIVVIVGGFIVAGVAAVGAVGAHVLKPLK